MILFPNIYHFLVHFNHIIFLIKPFNFTEILKNISSIFHKNNSYNLISSFTYCFTKF